MNSPEISRVTRSKADARENYDRLSRWYELVAGGFERRWRETGMRLLDPQPGENILEIGPGPGGGLVALARHVGPVGHAYGLDISSGMLRQARRRLTQAALSDAVGLVAGDGANVPFRSNAFDAVFMSFTLELFDTPEIGQVLASCRRVLNQHGRLAVVSLSSTAGSRAVRRLYEWSHRLLPRLVDCRPIPLAGVVSQSGFQILVARAVASFGLGIEIVTAGVPIGLAPG